MRFARQGVRQAQAREDWAWRMDNVRYFGGEAVLLLRSPWTALLSSWNHLQERVDLDLDTAEFQRFAMEEVGKWRDLAVDWLATSRRVLVVHYEKLKEDPEREVRRVLGFLKLKSDEQRLECMKGRRFEGFLRKRKKLEQSPYWKETHRRLQEVVQEVQEVLVLSGQEPLPLHLYSWQ